jgi:aspartate aminotransferase-like enzyme
MEQLRIPGPTPCPEEVLKAMSKQMINHRGPEFAKMFGDVGTKMQQIFQTKNDVLLLTGSGTGGLEAAAVNMFSPGDTVLSLACGVFGDRFGEIAKTFGANVISVKAEWGKAISVDAVKDALKAEPKIKAVMVTHNETSTGITNDLAKISAAVKDAGKLLVVDAISSLGSIDLPVDKWGCDVAITASQKGWMAPPGFTMISVSPAGWKANAAAKMPRFYWDFGKAKKYVEKGQTPWTPAVTTLFALDVGVDMMLKEGIQNVFARHARIGEATRKGIKSLGLTLFADEKYASNTVTAVAGSNGLDCKKLTKILREEKKIVLSGGQSSLEGKIFRIGHLGWVNENDIKDVLANIKTFLPQAGFVK